MRCERPPRSLHTNTIFLRAGQKKIQGFKLEIVFFAYWFLFSTMERSVSHEVFKCDYNYILNNNNVLIKGGVESLEEKEDVNKTQRECFDSPLFFYSSLLLSFFTIHVCCCFPQSGIFFACFCVCVLIFFFLFTSGIFFFFFCLLFNPGNVFQLSCVISFQYFRFSSINVRRSFQVEEKKEENIVILARLFCAQFKSEPMKIRLVCWNL